MQRQSYDVGLAIGQVENTLQLLAVFSDWFEESHKTDTYERTHTVSEVQIMWGDTPNFNAVLQAVVRNLNDLHSDLEEAEAEQENNK
jgi:hypothetical protein